MKSRNEQAKAGYGFQKSIRGFDVKQGLVRGFSNRREFGRESGMFLGSVVGPF